MATNIGNRFITLLCLLAGYAQAQGISIPFAGGVPGIVQMQAIEIQRHQARTLLYQEALEQLKKNPAAADIKTCEANALPLELCTPQNNAFPQPNPAQQTQRKIALLFGNNDYRAPIPPLETPIHDVEEIGKVLEKQFGYEVRLKKDNTKQDIIKALRQLAHDATVNDSVIIFYAGHGYLIEETKRGYWIPLDANAKDPRNWVSNTDISQLLASIPARQILLVSDSCYSGSLTKEQKIDISKTQTGEIYGLRSVLAFSSGGEEPVSDEGNDDHSIFAWSLLKELKTMEKQTHGREIYRRVHRTVSQEYPQEPQYGAVTSAGHANGGEYIFEPANKNP